MAENTKKQNIFLKILFIVGILILLIILAWGVIRFIPFLFNGFASVGQLLNSPFKSNQIALSVNQSEISSGQTVAVFWTNDKSEANNGYYSIKHSCVDNAEVLIKTEDGNKKLLCNIPYNLENSKSAELEIKNNKVNSLIDLPITITYNNSNNAPQKSGEIIITVVNENENSENAKDNAVIESEEINTENKSQSSNNAYTPSYTYSSTGKSDLVIRNAVALSDITIRFDIANTGARSTEAWYFEYKTPDGEKTISPIQPYLNPGQAIRYTLRFDECVDSGNVIVKVDPINVVSESNESNNTASIKIEGGDCSDYSDNVDYDKNDDANLEIIEIDSGYLSGKTFKEASSIDDNDEAAIRFVVGNTGGKSTGSWRFEVTELPYDNNDTYRSNRQSSLKPGETIEIIVGFDNPDKGTYDIKVEVDSNNDVDEENERDNKDDVRLRVTN